MNQAPVFKLMRQRPFAILLLTLILLTSCAKSNASSLPFIETFDNAGNWGTGEDAYSIGAVVNGVYDFKVLENDISRWVSAGKSFSDGIYEVEATPVEGPLDNGYGLIFRANPEAGDFYLFKVSADGYVWIGRYANGAEAATIIGDHWFESPAVLRGLNATNKLKVQAEAGNLIFYVNDQEVGRVTDNTLTKGDVGMLVQTLGGGGVRVLFDNLSVKPLP
ncbi:MAG: hypothetical protein LC131_08315 [Anaerolineae bacterium]|nr:hypothetical protein [Anaerolineae bacterium]